VHVKNGGAGKAASRGSMTAVMDDIASCLLGEADMQSSEINAYKTHEPDFRLCIDAICVTTHFDKGQDNGCEKRSGRG